jgi:hypothetical protein
MLTTPPDAADVVSAVVGDPPPTTDTWNVRIVILALALIALSVIVGAIYLTAVGKELPDTIVVIGSASAGSLGTLLASTRSTSRRP